MLTAAGAPNEPVVLDRIAVSGRYDATTRRFVVDEGDFGNANVGVALSGAMDFSSSDLRLRAGVAGTRMPVDSSKEAYAVFIAPKVRDWFNEHLTSGTLERIVIAQANAPFEALRKGWPVPDDGLSIEMLGTGCVVLADLPALRDADLNVHIAGRDVVVAVNKATADLPSGRKLVLSSGVFEVPDTAPHAPPCRVRFKLDGPIPAAAELLRVDRLREVADVEFDPAAIRGTMSALVTLGMPLKSDLPPGSTNYAITVDAANFSADRMIMGQKLESARRRGRAPRRRASSSKAMSIIRRHAGQSRIPQKRWGMFFWNPLTTPTGVSRPTPTALGLELRRLSGRTRPRHRECHTPRNVAMAVDNGKRLAGAMEEAPLAGTLTGDRVHGLGGWSDAQLAQYLATGYAEGHGPASGPMAEVVEEQLRLSDAGRYLGDRHLPAQRSGAA